MCVVGGGGRQGDVTLEARGVLLHKGLTVDVARPQALCEGAREGEVEGYEKVCQ